MNHLHRLRDGWSEVENWVRQFEMALDDSTLVQTYRRLRNLSQT